MGIRHWGIRAVLVTVVLLAFVGALAGLIPAVAVAGFHAKADFATGDRPSYIVADDFNGDGRPDLATTSDTGNTVCILLGNGGGGFSAATDFATGGWPRSPVIADFNLDDKKDLATANLRDSTVSVLLGGGDGTFADKADLFVGGDLLSCAAGDFNGDGKPDLAVPSASAKNVGILLGHGDGTFADMTVVPLTLPDNGGNPFGIAAADLDGDSTQDLLVTWGGNFQDPSVSVLLGHGDGTFTAKPNVLTSAYPYSVVVADFNGDGKKDFATGNYQNFGPSNVSVLLGNGDGTFADKTDFPAGAYPTSIVADDFNCDGKQDLATASSDDSTVSVLLGQGDGTFATKTDFRTGANPNSVTACDFNGDDKPDLATANITDGTVSVLLNDGDPVPAVDGNSDTAKPVLVLIAGLNSNTGYRAVPLVDGGTVSLEDGWKLNSPDTLGDPWKYLGAPPAKPPLAPKKSAAEMLGAFSALVMPTAAGATSWPSEARSAGWGYVLDSNGSLAGNMVQLAFWLQSEKVKSLTHGHPIILVGHSYGGVIARSMLASDVLPYASAVRKQIAGIIQMGSPNGGSPLATAANLTGPYKSAFTLDLAQGAMTGWNAKYSGAVEVPVVRFGGTYAPWADDVMDDLSYLPVFDTILGGPSDGLVAYDSVDTGYDSLADESYDFGGGECTPYPDLAHAWDLPGAGKTYSWWPGPFQPAIPVTFGGLVPRNSSDTLFVPLAQAVRSMAGHERAVEQAPVRQSTARAASLATASASVALPARELPRHDASIPSGGAAHITVPLDAAATIVVSSSGGAATVSVRNASGNTLDCASTTEEGTDGAFTTMLQVKPVDAGDFAFDVTLPPGASGDVTLAGSIGGGAQLTLASGESPYAGASAALTARFESASGAPLVDAVVSGIATSDGVPDVPLAFRDDGTGDDATARDGVYTSTFTPPTPGRWVARIEARHATAERAGSLIVDAGDELAAVVGPLAEVTPAGPGATLASFGIAVPLQVSEEGTYTVCADLSDSTGSRIGIVRTSAHLESLESSTLVAAIDASQLSGIATGKLTVSPIRITRLTDGIDLAAGSAPGLTSSRSYAATDFYSFSVSLSGPAANPSATHQLHFAGTALNTASTVASVEYTIDGGVTWQPTLPSDGAFDSHSEDFAIDLDLPDYVYGILVRQTGADGTQLPVADWAGIRFAVDTLAPPAVTDLAALVTDDAGSSVVDASWSASEAPSDTTSLVRYLVALDDVEIGTTFDTSLEVPDPGSGPHTLTVTPIDEAGNSGPSRATSFVIDTTPPTTVTSGADDGWHNSDVTVTLTPTDDLGGSGMSGGSAKTEYKLDAGDWTPGISVTVTAPADHSNDGTHTISYHSTDATGNVEDAKACTVNIDTTTPVGTFALAGGAATTTTAAISGGSSVDDVHGPLQMRFSTDDQDTWSGWETYAASRSITLPGGLGDKTVYAEYRDAAGNVLGLSDSIELVAPADVTDPTISISGAAEGKWYRSAVLVTLTATGGGSGVASITYTLDGVETTVPSSLAIVNVPASPNARHSLTFHATDVAANSCADQTLSFTIDTTGATTAGRATSGRKGRKITLRYRISDNLSPKATAVKLVVKNRKGKVVKRFYLHTRTTGDWYSVKWRPRARGTYRYYVYGKDLAGNAQRKVGSARIRVR